MRSPTAQPMRSSRSPLEAGAGPRPWPLAALPVSLPEEAELLARAPDATGDHAPGDKAGRRPRFFAGVAHGPMHQSPASVEASIIASPNAPAQPAPRRPMVRRMPRFLARVKARGHAYGLRGSGLAHPAPPAPSRPRGLACSPAHLGPARRKDDPSFYFFLLLSPRGVTRPASRMRAHPFEVNPGDTPLTLSALLLFQSPSSLTLWKLFSLLALGERSHHHEFAPFRGRLEGLRGPSRRTCRTCTAGKLAPVLLA